MYRPTRVIHPNLLGGEGTVKGGDTYESEQVVESLYRDAKLYLIVKYDRLTIRIIIISYCTLDS